MNLDGKKQDDSEFIHLINNAVRNEVERAIEQIGIKAGVIAVNSGQSENTISNWRTRRTTLDVDQLESITNVIAKFKDFLE
jgi:predicted metal-dependent phosphotriesterase family hydrolase